MKNNIKLNSHLIEEIVAYCEANELSPSKYVNGLLLRAFTADRFGESPIKKSTPTQQTEPTVVTDIYTEQENSNPTETIEQTSEVVEPQQSIIESEDNAVEAIETDGPKRISKKTKLN